MRSKFLLILFSLGLFFIREAIAYVPSLTSQLKPLYWPKNKTAISLNYNPINSSSILEDEIQEIFSDAINEWGAVSGSNISFSLKKNLNIGDNTKNEIFFTDDPSLFGAGVVGIALVSYKDSTGEIIEADIALNDSVDFSTDKDSSLYLGNVVTHEVGHFLGLGHEPTLEATMFYQAERGQFKLSEIDKQSILQLYANETEFGGIEGKVIGGNSLLGLFGVQVMALSPSGIVAATQLTDADGKFKIKGLLSNQVYYIYTKPIAFKSSLPSIYSEARSNFCMNGDNFRGSFFQTCMKADEGFPTSISVSNNNIKSVGNVTVRCGLDVPQKYFLSKENSTPFDLDFNKFQMSTAFTGYFSKKEMLENKEDIVEFTIPTDATSLGEQNNFDVRINFRSQIFYSIYKADLSILKNNIKIWGRTETTSDLDIEEDYSLKLDKDIVISASMGDEITIKIKPKDWFYYLQVEENVSPIRPADRRIYSTKDFFPGFLISSFDSSTLALGEAAHYKNSMNLKDSLNWYLLSIETRMAVNDERMGGRFFLDSDNSQCPDAANAYLVKKPLAASQATPKKSKSGKIDSDMPLACGSIEQDLDGDGPSGGIMQMFLGFVFVFLLKSLRNNKLRPHKFKI